jgi:hypothetical protein
VCKVYLDDEAAALRTAATVDGSKKAAKVSARAPPAKGPTNQDQIYPVCTESPKSAQRFAHLGARGAQTSCPAARRRRTGSVSASDRRTDVPGRSGDCR